MIPVPMNPILSAVRLSLRVLLHPAQRILGPLGAGLVLETDPGVISGIVDGREDDRPVELAGAGLVPAGVIGDLNMPDRRDVVANRGDDLALGPLGVIDVVLDLQIRVFAAATTAKPSLGRDRKKPGASFGLSGSVTSRMPSAAAWSAAVPRFAIRVARCSHPGRPKALAGHAVHLGRFQNPRIFHRLVQRGAEIVRAAPDR